MIDIWGDSVSGWMARWRERSTRRLVWTFLLELAPNDGAAQEREEGSRTGGSFRLLFLFFLFPSRSSSLTPAITNGRAWGGRATRRRRRTADSREGKKGRREGGKEGRRRQRLTRGAMDGLQVHVVRFRL